MEQFLRKTSRCFWVYYNRVVTQILHNSGSVNEDKNFEIVPNRLVLMARSIVHLFMKYNIELGYPEIQRI